MTHGPSAPVPVAHGGTRYARLWSLVLAWTGLVVQPGVRGHDLFTAYIQHRVGLTVGKAHVDVTVQLTFFEDSSEHEREHLDTDQDGRIDGAERREYLRQFADKLEGKVRLKADGEEWTLIPLYAPELDLLGNDTVGRAHHRLTLYFFAASPEVREKGTELVVEDRLWPDVRALASLEAQGREGWRLEVAEIADPVFPPAREGEARKFRFHGTRSTPEIPP